MFALLTLLIVLALALLFARVATQALVHTGLSEEVSRFQAWSCLSGVGYTTKEAESIVNHPVRRRISMVLMMVGNVGIVTVVSSMILAFINEGDEVRLVTKLGVLILGLGTFWFLGTSKWLNRKLKGMIDRALDRYTHVGVRDFESLLELSATYSVSELFIENGDWVAGKTLRDSGLRKEGLTILGIQRADGTFEGEMTPDTRVHEQDNVLVYGRLASIESVDQRQRGGAGDLDHRRAIEEHERELQDSLSKDTEDPDEKDRESQGNKS